MSVFAVVALAAAVMALGVVIVAALQLLTVARRLRDAAEAMSTRLGPLQEELEGELSVMRTELDSLEATRDGRPRVGTGRTFRGG